MSNSWPVVIATGQLHFTRYNMSGLEIHRIIKLSKNNTVARPAGIDYGHQRNSGGCSWSDITDKPAFADVATTGSYRDLSNKPTIPPDYGTRVIALEQKMFVATYGSTTAQEILQYANPNNEPFAPIIIRRGNDYHTATSILKQNEQSVILRAIGTISGVHTIFTYTITNGSWATSVTQLQEKV